MVDLWLRLAVELASSTTGVSNEDVLKLEFSLVILLVHMKVEGLLTFYIHQYFHILSRCHHHNETYEGQNNFQ